MAEQRTTFRLVGISGVLTLALLLGLLWLVPAGAAPPPATPITPDNAAQVTELAKVPVPGIVGWVIWSDDGRRLAVGVDMGVYLYDSQTLTETRFIETPTESFGISFSPDGQMLATALHDGTVRLWRVSDGTLVRTLQGHTNAVDAVAFSPDGQTLASASWDGTVRLWRVSDPESAQPWAGGTPLHTLEGHWGAVNSVAFSPDGQTLASASEYYAVRLWRVSDGTLLRELGGRSLPVYSLSFSPDGLMLASGSDDQTVHLWRVSDPGSARPWAGGTVLSTLKGHTSEVSDVDFSPDGRVLASSSGDKTVRLWRVSDGAPLRTLEGHTMSVGDVAFSPDGTVLASGSTDSTVRLWGIK